MIIPERIWRDIINALRIYIKTDSDDVFSDKFVEVLHNIDKHLDNILKQISYGDSYKSKIRKVLLYLSRNIDRTLNFLSNPPDEIKELVFDYLLNNIGITDEDPVTEKISEYWKKELMKYMPLMIEKGKKKIPYRVLYPDDNELNNIPTPDKYEVASALHYILTRNIQIDLEKGLVGIRGYQSIFLPPKGLMRVLSLINMENDKIVEEAYSELVSELLKYGTVKVSDASSEKATINVELTNISREISMRYGVEHLSIIMTVGVNKWKDVAVVESYISFRLNGKEVYYSLDVHDLEKACKFVSCSEPVSFRNGVKVPILLNKINAYIDVIYKASDYLTKMLKEFYTEAQRYGFDEERYAGGEVKKENEDVNIDVWLLPFGSSNPDEPPEVHYIIRVLDQEPHIIAYLENKVRNILNKNEKYEIYGSMGENIRIEGNIKITKDFDFESIFKRVNNLVSTANKLIEEAKDTYSRKDTNIPDEAYIALHMAHLLPGNHIYIGKITNMDVESVSNIVRSIMKKLGIDMEMYMKNKFVFLGDLGDILIRLKYVTIDDNLKLYINGKRLSDLLVNYFPSISKREAKNTEREIVNGIINHYITESEDSGKLPFQTLLEVGLLNNNVIRRAIKLNDHLDPENFAIEVNGKPVWEYLSDEIKTIYITRTDVRMLNKIFRKPELLKVFSDKLDLIEKTILSDGTSDDKTIHVYLNKKYSNIVGNDVEVVAMDSYGKIYEGEEVLDGHDPIFLRPKYAKHLLIQVLDVGTKSSKFIVVDTNKKDGFVIEAKSIHEAVEIFEKQYDRLRIIFTKISELCRLNNIREIIPMERKPLYPSITYKYIEKDTGKKIEILPVNEDTLKEIRNYLNRKKSNEELVSA